MSNCPGRLAFVTQWFSPEEPSIALSISKALRHEGWSVSALTGIPNFPAGKVFAGYSAWRVYNEEIDGITVRRAPLFPSHDRSTLRRVANYVSWAVSASFVGRRVLRTADVCLVYSSPATAALPAMAARKLHRKPYVLMVQDLWPDSIFASGFFPAGTMRKIAESLTGAFVDATYRHAAHVAVISPGMKMILESRGVPDEKVSVVYNWVGEETLSPASPDHSWRAELGLEPDDFVVMYAGTHGFAQDLGTAVDAFGLMPAEARCHLVLVGDGVEKPGLIARAAKVAPDRVHFLPWVLKESIGATMAAAEVQLVSLKDDPLFRITMPSKVQSVLASGLPALVVASGDAADVVEKARAGVAVEPGDPRALAKAVLTLEAMGKNELRHLGENGRRYYHDEMSESIGAMRLSDVLTVAAGKAEGEKVGSRGETN